MNSMSEGGGREYRREIGLRVRQIREAQGLSLRKLALMVGMDYKYLFSIEHGEANATIDVLAKIADGLNIELRDLFV